MSSPARQPAPSPGTPAQAQAQPAEPAHPAELTEPAIVARLRAAGCVFAEEEARLLLSAGADPDRLAAMVDRRAAGEPLEHVLGWAEFCGLRIAVEPGVFVPRHRTEFLVAEAAAALAVSGRAPVVLDLCCGSGAIGAALAAAVGPIELYAADHDPAAVRCARRNLAAAGGRVFLGDLYQPLPAGLRGRIELIAANVPYVPTGRLGLLPPEAREHEPRAALDGGPDGLDPLRRVAAEAPRWLAPGGRLLIEVSPGQAAGAEAAFAAAGLRPRLTGSPERDTTIVIGSRSQ